MNYELSVIPSLTVRASKEKIQAPHVSKGIRGTKPQYGFSLIEVLFAMLILTSGMIFVAMQFPVGLANSRKQVDETLKVINTHNAKIMMELQIGSLVNSAVQVIKPGATPLPDGDALLLDDGNVHLLPKVNLLANDFTNGRQTMVIDNPENILDLSTSGVNYTLTDFYSTVIDFFPPYITIDSSNDLKLGSLGGIMSPLVTSSDVEVVNILDFQYGGTYNPTSDGSPDYSDKNAAIYDVALTRTYSWCALYKSIDQNTIRFYIFTLRKGKNTYAMQNDASIYPPVVFSVRNDTEDRVYPVPWLVDLNNGSGTSGVGYGPGVGFRNFIDVINGGTKNAPNNNAPREFEIDAAFTDLFQAGTIIIDADLEDIPLVTPWEDNGYVYEVMEITQDSSGAYFLRLQKPLEDDLNLVWVVPPSYDRNNGEFGEVDPVVDVAEQVIRF